MSVPPTTSSQTADVHVRASGLARGKARDFQQARRRGHLRLKYRHGFMDADFHPILVHFPIAITIVVALLDWGRWLFDRERLFAAGFWEGTTPLLIAGLLGALAAVITGLSAEHAIAEKTREVRALLEAHELVAFLVTGLLALLVLWRIAGRGAFPRSGYLGYLILLAIAAAAVMYGANLGAEMVHMHGVGISAP